MMMVMDLLIVGVAGSQVTSEAAKKIPSVDDDDKKGLKTYFFGQPDHRGGGGRWVIPFSLTESICQKIGPIFENQPK